MSLTWTQFNTEVKLYLHLYNEVANIQTLITNLISSGAADMQRFVPYYQTGHVDSYEASAVTRDGLASFLTAPNGKIRSVRMVKQATEGAIAVSGAGTSIVNGTYLLAGENDGKPFYDATLGGITYRITWFESSYWTVLRTTDSFDMYTSGDDTATPDLATWVAGSIGDAPAPTVASTADQDVFRSLTQVNWSHYHKMRAGEVPCGSGFVAINPVTRQMAVVPQLNTETKLYIDWDGIKTNFSGGDVTPFDARMAEAVAYFVLARVNRVVDRDLQQAASYEAEYLRLKKKIASDQNWNHIITGDVPSQLDSVQPTIIE